MKKSLALCLLGSSLLTIVQPALANEPDSTAGLHLLGTFGLTYGGDKLATIEYTNGDDVDIHAGSLLLFGLGVNYEFGNNWELQTSFNYQFDRADARNGDVNFSRWPIDVLGFYRFGNHRFGGGVTYHTNVEFEVDLPNANGTVDFDDATGAVLEYDYFFMPSLSVGLRGTLIDYKDSDFGDTVSGNSIGLFINGYFF